MDYSVEAAYEKSFGYFMFNLVCLPTLFEFGLTLQ